MQRAVEEVFRSEFRGRILPFDEAAANAYSTLAAHHIAIGRPISQFDAMIASICVAHGLSLATRNGADFAHCGIQVVNPWAT